jgi:hypothetical protein
MAYGIAILIPPPTSAIKGIMASEKSPGVTGVTTDMLNISHQKDSLY